VNTVHTVSTGSSSSSSRVLAVTRRNQYTQPHIYNTSAARQATADAAATHHTSIDDSCASFDAFDHIQTLDRKGGIEKKLRKMAG